VVIIGARFCPEQSYHQSLGCRMDFWRRTASRPGVVSDGWAQARQVAARAALDPAGADAVTSSRGGGPARVGVRVNADIIEFIRDPQLLGLTLSPAQTALLKAIYARPMSEEELVLYRACTGREDPPPAAFGEVTVVAGARSGKDSRIAAPIVVYEATRGGHERHLARGERGVIPLVAQDTRAARVAFGFVKDYLTRSPLLAGLVAETLANEIALTNGLAIMCFPCTLRSLRGWSIPVGVLDELVFFRLEGAADSDTEIQASVRRGMVSFPHTKLIKISTPYMRGGVLFEDFTRGFGQSDADLLVWRASSMLMNPSLRAERLERERRLDPLRFAREYEGEFADDLEAFLPSVWVDDAVVAGRHQLPARVGISYLAAVDPSGGGPDHFTLSVVHAEGRGTERVVIQDLMRGWGRHGSQAPDLVGVVREIAELLKGYNLRGVGRPLRGPVGPPGVSRGRRRLSRRRARQERDLRGRRAAVLARPHPDPRPPAARPGVEAARAEAAGRWPDPGRPSEWPVR
jgi:hypothetical protein